MTDLNATELYAKYDSEGMLQWAARYNGPGDSYDGARDMVVDALGSVYVTGGTYSSESALEDYCTVKYDSTGNKRWATRYNGGVGYLR